MGKVRRYLYRQSQTLQPLPPIVKKDIVNHLTNDLK